MTLITFFDGLEWIVVGRLKDWNVIVDLGPVPLSDALCDPDDVSALLLLQLEERVEHAKVELLHERVHVQLDLKKKIMFVHFKVWRSNKITSKSQSFLIRDYLKLDLFIFHHSTWIYSYCIPETDDILNQTEVPILLFPPLELKSATKSLFIFE